MLRRMSMSVLLYAVMSLLAAGAGAAAIDNPDAEQLLGRVILRLKPVAGTIRQLELEVRMTSRELDAVIDPMLKSLRVDIIGVGAAFDGGVTELTVRAPDFRQMTRGEGVVGVIRLPVAVPSDRPCWFHVDVYQEPAARRKAFWLGSATLVANDGNEAPGSEALIELPAESGKAGAVAVDAGLTGNDGSVSGSGEKLRIRMTPLLDDTEVGIIGIGAELGEGGSELTIPAAEFRTNRVEGSIVGTIEVPVKTVTDLPAWFGIDVYRRMKGERIAVTWLGGATLIGRDPLGPVAIIESATAPGDEADQDGAAHRGAAARQPNRPAAGLIALAEAAEQAVSYTDVLTAKQGVLRSLRKSLTSGDEAPSALEWRDLIAALHRDLYPAQRAWLAERVRAIVAAEKRSKDAAGCARFVAAAEAFWHVDSGAFREVIREWFGSDAWTGADAEGALRLALLAGRRYDMYDEFLAYPVDATVVEALDLRIMETDPGYAVLRDLALVWVLSGDHKRAASRAQQACTKLFASSPELADLRDVAELLWRTRAGGKGAATLARVLSARLSAGKPVGTAEDYHLFGLVLPESVAMEQLGSLLDDTAAPKVGAGAIIAWSAKAAGGLDSFMAEVDDNLASAVGNDAKALWTVIQGYVQEIRLRAGSEKPGSWSAKSIRRYAALEKAAELAESDAVTAEVLREIANYFRSRHRPAQAEPTLGKVAVRGPVSASARHRQREQLEREERERKMRNQRVIARNHYEQGWAHIKWCRRAARRAAARGDKTTEKRNLDKIEQLRSKLPPGAADSPPVHSPGIAGTEQAAPKGGAE